MEEDERPDDRTVKVLVRLALDQVISIAQYAQEEELTFDKAVVDLIDQALEQPQQQASGAKQRF